MLKVISFVLVFGILVMPALATDLYVATTGDDNAIGSQTTPFKTLSKAKAAVRNLLQSSGDPINVYVRAGTYYMDSTLVFTPQDGGTATRPVTYSSYQNEKVILSGGRKITPAWSTYSGSIMVANIGSDYDFDMLFLNDDKLLIMARYPNFDSTQILDGCTNINNRISRWKNPAGGFLRAIHGSEWGGVSFKILGVAAGKLNLQFVGDNNNGDPVDSNKQMVENVFEELDSPGEWFYDKSAGKLYLYPPAGSDLSSSFLVGATLEELISIAGTDTTKKVEYLTFSGFSFTHMHRTLFTGKYESLGRADWTIVREGVIFIQNAEDITIKDCLFSNIGGNGIFMSGCNFNHVVQNCDFTNIGATAVAIAGLPDAVRSYCTWQSCQSPPKDLTPGPAGNDYPGNITVTYCYVYNNGMFEKQTSAVCISMSQNVTVSHCTAHHGPRAGLNVCDGTFGGHTFEFNDIFDQVRETQDHGPFNSWGRDRWWNRGFSDADCRKYALLDIWKPNTIRFNRISNPAGRTNFGIDLDDGSTNYQIYNNLLINMGVKSQHGFNHFVSNNTIINYQVTCHQWNLPDMQKFFTHNIIVYRAPYYCRTKDFFPNTGEIDSNVYWNNGSPVTMEIDNGTSEISATPTWTQDKLDLHSVTADPQFVDPSHCNYQVKAGSPALTLGFTNFPMDQFGKPGYPSCPGCSPAVVKVGPSSRALSGELPAPSMTALGGRNAFRLVMRTAAEVTFRVYTLRGCMILERAVVESAGATIVSWERLGKLANEPYVIEMRTCDGHSCHIRTLKML